MKFLDQVKIYVKAGNGGHGSPSFRREKFIEYGDLMVAMEVKVAPYILGQKEI